jgi:hypothetical protein
MKGAVLDVRNLSEDYKEVLLGEVIESFKRRNLDSIVNKKCLVAYAGWWYFSPHKYRSNSPLNTVTIGWDLARTEVDPEYTLINLEDFQ